MAGESLDVNIVFDQQGGTTSNVDAAEDRKAKARAAMEEARARRMAATEERQQRKRAADEEKSKRLIDYRLEKNRETREAARVAREERQAERKAQRDAQRASQAKADRQASLIDEALSIVARRTGLGSVLSTGTNLFGSVGQRVVNTSSGGGSSPPPPGSRRNQSSPVPPRPPRANSPALPALPAPPGGGGVIPPAPPALPAGGAGGGAPRIPSMVTPGKVLLVVAALAALAVAASVTVMALNSIRSVIARLREQIDKTVSSVSKYNAELAMGQGLRRTANVISQINQANRFAQVGGGEYIIQQTRSEVELRRLQTEFYALAIPMITYMRESSADTLSILASMMKAFNDSPLTQGVQSFNSTLADGNKAIIRLVKDGVDFLSILAGSNNKTKKQNIFDELAAFMGVDSNLINSQPSNPQLNP